MLDLILGLIIGFFIAWFHYSKKLNKAFDLWVSPYAKFTPKELNKRKKEFYLKIKNNYKMEVN